MDLQAQVVLWVTWFLFSFAWLIAALWLFRRGQTPGKRIMGIRVVKRNGDPAGWWRMFAREVVPHPQSCVCVVPHRSWLESHLRTVELTAPFLNIFGIAMVVGYLLSLWDKNRQALHDKVVGTAVVRARR